MTSVVEVTLNSFSLSYPLDSFHSRHISLDFFPPYLLYLHPSSMTVPSHRGLSPYSSIIRPFLIILCPFRFLFSNSVEQLWTGTLPLFRNWTPPPNNWTKWADVCAIIIIIPIPPSFLSVFFSFLVPTYLYPGEDDSPQLFIPVWPSPNCWVDSHQQRRSGHQRHEQCTWCVLFGIFFHFSW